MHVNSFGKCTKCPSNKVSEVRVSNSTGILCCIYLGYFSTYKEKIKLKRGVKERIGNDKSEL